MKDVRNMVTVLTVVAVMAVGQASAIDFGKEITLYDGSSLAGWWGPQEDNEVEPYVLTIGQTYDLEGFAQDGNSLTMVSGYNFWAPPRTDMDPGDVFIDVTGDVVFGVESDGSGAIPVNNVWGYDYVYDLDFVNNTYALYKIDASTQVRNVLYGTSPDNREANPWNYHSGGAEIVSGVSFNYWNNLTDLDLAAYPFTGGDHYAVQVDLSQIPMAGGTEFTAHFTMACGNDNLMGRSVAIPDGGMTVMLLSGAVLGLAILRTRMHVN